MLFILTTGLSVLGVILVLLYRKKNTIIIPNITLFILGFLEFPVKQLIWLFGIDESFIDQMAVEIRNRLYKHAFARIPYTQRAIFLPQCLRHPKCPASLEAEGLICKSCGRCGINLIKEYAEQLGYKVFIAPGSTLIKRMIKKHGFKGVIGVGCVLEVYEGSRLMASAGLPVQAVTLSRDGCVDTRVDVNELLEMITYDKEKIRKWSIHDDERLLELSRKISGCWENTPTDISVKAKTE